MSILTLPCPAASGDHQPSAHALRVLGRCPITLAVPDAPTVAEYVARGRVKPEDVLKAVRAVALTDLGRWLLWARLDHLAPDAHRLPPAAQAQAFDVMVSWLLSSEGAEARS